MTIVFSGTTRRIVELLIHPRCMGQSSVLGVMPQFIILAAREGLHDAIRRRVEHFPRAGIDIVSREESGHRTSTSLVAVL